MAETLFFDPEGGAVSVEIRSGHAQDGSYSITLWSENKVAERFEGNFIDPHDDTHKLKTQAKSLDGRLLQARAEIGITPPITQFAVIVTLFQDGMSIGSLTRSGNEPTRITVPVNLFARLLPRL